MTHGSASSRIWYHTIDLPDGTATPGWFDTRVSPGEVDWPRSLRGGRALDVGTFDGFWAFELERRGAAEVIALDVDDPDQLDWFFDERERGPELVRQCPALLVLHVGQQDLGAGLREPASDPRPDPRGSPRDDGRGS